MIFRRIKSFSLVGLITPEDSTPVGSAMASSAAKPSLSDRTFAVAKVLLWVSVSLVLAGGISQLQ